MKKDELLALLETSKKRKNKHNAERVVFDGHTFDSKAECARYRWLRTLERAGRITGLRLQVKFELARGVTLDGHRKPALRYFADFVYLDEAGKQIVEDVKGMVTPTYRIKRHLMKSVHGIEVQEIRS
ncbi:DUF1064 domain-containing protein [Piscinibacter gummiphilus]|uniref:DUF1064 domain-containing protein n=1 Tax=Piscinibacter gummiphilus TaxID=946333 RepID=A0ABZ0CU93_9BURK|nr:DUF1064 domain-containing protein [Piscinibacter gummiphilus]WOB06525.1 DUF1064 domain-containing protein [Piscinibacter gummiphilus]